MGNRRQRRGRKSDGTRITKKFIELKNGERISGDSESIREEEDNITIETDWATITVNRDKVFEVREVPDIDSVDPGEYVQTDSGIYLKIDNMSYRLVRGDALAPIDLDDKDLIEIEPVAILSHADVFPPAELEDTESPEDATDPDPEPE